MVQRTHLWCPCMKDTTIRKDRQQKYLGFRLQKTLQSHLVGEKDNIKLAVLYVKRGPSSFPWCFLFVDDIYDDGDGRRGAKRDGWNKCTITIFSTNLKRKKKFQCDTYGLLSKCSIKLEGFLAASNGVCFFITLTRDSRKMPARTLINE